MNVASVGEKRGQVLPEEERTVYAQGLCFTKEKPYAPFGTCPTEDFAGPLVTPLPHLCSMAVAQLRDKVAWGMTNGHSLNRAWLIDQAGRQG